VSTLVVKILHLNHPLPTVLIFCTIVSLFGIVTSILLTMIGMCEESAVISKEQSSRSQLSLKFLNMGSYYLVILLKGSTSLSSQVIRRISEDLAMQFPR
jgi:hypothetical protein